MPLGPELVSAQAAELSGRHLSCRVRKVEAGDSWTALFISRGDTLFFSWDAEAFGLCYASQAEIRTMLSAAGSRPPIADALKSHLTGAELVSASAPGRDRALELRFFRAVGAGVRTERLLILEASGRYSNAILADADGRVIEAAKHIHPDVNRYRSVLPGASYSPPPPLSGVALEEIDPSSPDAGAALSRAVGLGRPLIEAIASAGWIDLVPSYIDTSSSMRWQALKRYVTLCPRILPGARELDARSALEAARETVICALLSRRADQLRRRISARLERARELIQKKMASAEEAVAREESTRDMVRIGRLIASSGGQIPPGASSALLTEWTEDGPREVSVDLDPKLDAHGNAERLFARRKKYVRASEMAKKDLDRLAAEMSAVDEQSAMLACHTEIDTLRAMDAETDTTPKKNKKEALPPHGRMDLPELYAMLYWGLSSRGNRYVTSRLAISDDLWFHAKDIPGSHVVLRFTAAPDEQSFDAAVELAASCAIELSRAKGERADVDFTERRYVRPIPGGGGSLVTYREFSTITIDGSRWRDRRASPSQAPQAR